MGTRGGQRAEALEVDLQAAVVEIGTGAGRTPMRPFPSVEAFVELQVNKLSKPGWTEFALVRPLP